MRPGAAGPGALVPGGAHTVDRGGLNSTSARPGTVGQLSSWLENLDPELEAFVHLRQAGVDFDQARAQCLQDQGEAFEMAWAKALAGNPLVTHDNLAGFAALSQKGFGRNPRELRWWCAGATG